MTKRICTYTFPLLPVSEKLECVGILQMLLIEQEKVREGVERNGKKNQQGKKASLLQSRERTVEDML